MFKDIADINVDWLKQNNQMIHFFGLGFIQLKINDRFRLHFYSPSLPSIVGKEDVHNHRYDFKSTILKGMITQELYARVSGNTHTMEQESCKDMVEHKAVSTECAIIMLASVEHLAGTSYWIQHDTLHRVYTKGSTITLLDRGPYAKELADVIRPRGSSKVCPFSVKLTESDLWEIVELELRT
jgi:hypothetical protein